MSVILRATECNERRGEWRPSSVAKRVRDEVLAFTRREPAKALRNGLLVVEDPAEFSESILLHLSHALPGHSKFAPDLT